MFNLSFLAIIFLIPRALISKSFLVSFILSLPIFIKNLTGNNPVHARFTNVQQFCNNWQQFAISVKEPLGRLYFAGILYMDGYIQRSLSHFLPLLGYICCFLFGTVLFGTAFIITCIWIQKSPPPLYFLITTVSLLSIIMLSILVWKSWSGCFFLFDQVRFWVAYF